VNLVQLLNGLALGALLMILGFGLAAIYGRRGVTNVSDGAFVRHLLLPGNAIAMPREALA
jgi:branched-subunit amino acid ABC-type transport system permease component